MKKVIKLKINYLLKNWNYFNFLRKNGILIFCQNLSLNALKDLETTRYLNDLNYKWKILNKKVIKYILDENFLRKIKNFNNILIMNNINEINKIEQYLIKKNILILGYCVQNIFFFKKDFDIKRKEKKSIADSLKKRIIQFYLYKKKIIMNIKSLLFKFILLLKKKNGDN